LRQIKEHHHLKKAKETEQPANQAGIPMKDQPQDYPQRSKKHHARLDLENQTKHFARCSQLPNGGQCFVDAG
jgi:hypothetical protein